MIAPVRRRDMGKAGTCWSQGIVSERELGVKIVKKGFNVEGFRDAARDEVADNRHIRKNVT